MCGPPDQMYLSPAGPGYREDFSNRLSKGWACAATAKGEAVRDLLRAHEVGVRHNLVEMTLGREAQVRPVLRPA